MRAYFESETEEEKKKKKQKLRTTSNTPKTTAKHLQTPKQGTSFKLPLLITPFLALLAQLQIPSSPLIRFSRIEDFQLPKSPIQQQEPISTSTNLIDYLAENQSEKTKSEQETEDLENKKEMAFTYIAKISEFTGENSKTSPQEWLDKVSKAEDANGWNTARIRIHQLETNKYYSNAQILDQFIAGLKDKLIKKVCPHAPEDLATAIQQVKNYEMAMKEANHTKLVNLTIGKTSSVAEEKIDQLTKKVEKPTHYHTQPSYLTIPKKSNFQQTALFEGEATAPRQNPSNNTIPPARIAQNANFSDIFLFKFEANELPSLLSNVAVNEQKAITAMYTEAKLQRTIDRPTQTVIVMADGMKKTPVGEINNFPFTIDGITIPIKVLVMDTPQYQALVRNDWLLKANANLDWETQELKISY
ncbi:hypothetical protein G9A89_004555 [Geosiphon pyriformis]|nr:hypothetical protein G9A89_004555 [Geosiphon pyriformis]